MRTGPLHPALAASIAVPGLTRPVAIGKRVLIDGGTTNPLPFDRLHGLADFVVAIDVVSLPPSERADIPGAWASMITTINIMGSAIVAAKLAQKPPDLIIRPRVGIFRTLGFYQATAILRAASAVKREVKERLGNLLA